MDLTRRSLLYALGDAASLARPLNARVADAALPHPRGGRLGLELYSLRNQLKKDLAGTLKLVRDWGFDEVELAGFPSMPAADTAGALRPARLRAGRHFADFPRPPDRFGGRVRGAHTVRLETAIFGLIPPPERPTRAE